MESKEMLTKETLEKFAALSMFYGMSDIEGYWVMRVPGGYIIERVNRESTDNGMFVPWSAVLSDPDVETKK